MPKNNLYKGEKPKPLTKSTPAGSATVYAGAAKTVPGVVASSSVVGSGASSLQASVRPKDFASPMLFEKTMKCFAAIAAVCSPQGFQQEFLADSGAGRNLISTKDMPVQWNDFIADAPEQLRFATGGGMRPSSKALKLKGEVSGEGIFYTLKDCPAAIITWSTGQ